MARGGVVAVVVPGEGQGGLFGAPGDEGVEVTTCERVWAAGVDDLAEARAIREGVRPEGDEIVGVT